MGAVVALSNLLDARQVWRGRAVPIMEGEQPTGWPQRDCPLVPLTGHFKSLTLIVMQ